MEFLKIILLSLLAAIGYGILHDLVTAHVCVEYFTVGHPPIFRTESPVLLALGWGVLATWWVGIILGIPLAGIARIGTWPKLSVKALIGPLLILLAVSGVMATVAGFIGYAIDSPRESWVAFLMGPALSSQIAPERRPLFFADLCAHNVSYFVGFVGGIAVWVYAIIWRWRKSRPRQQEPETSSTFRRSSVLKRPTHQPGPPVG